MPRKSKIRPNTSRTKRNLYQSLIFSSQVYRFLLALAITFTRAHWTIVENKVAALTEEIEAEVTKYVQVFGKENNAVSKILNLSATKTLKQRLPLTL